MTTDYIFIDLETRSFADLPSVGAWVYGEDQTTDVICLAYKNGSDIKTWKPGETIPKELKTFKGKFIARNAIFEYAIFKNVLVPRYGFPDRMARPENWFCSRASSLLAGMPGSLAKSAVALGTSKKLETGNYLINKYSKPAKNKDGSLYFRSFEPGDFQAMVDYNIQDVRADFETFQKVKSIPNIEIEQAIFDLDFKQNINGVKVDVKSLDKILAVFNEKTKAAEQRMSEIGVNVRSPKQMIEHFKSKGYNLPNLQEKTVQDIRAKIKEKELLELLDLRAFLGKASVKKFQALKDRTDRGGRIRYMLRYFGAHTGRFSGNGFQPHNLPRTKTSPDEIDRLIEDFSLNLTYTDMIDHGKRILPGLIIPDNGKTFIIGDLLTLPVNLI